MAKSQIIKDLANSEVDTQTALKRTKVLLQELENDELLQWINYEIEGYPEDVEVPKYREINGQLYGSYTKGSMSYYREYKNVSLPSGNLSVEMKKEILTTKITQGVQALKDMVSGADKGENTRLAKPIPADYYPYIAQANNDLYMMITIARVELNMLQISDIFSKVENKLLDILIYLEKQFGNLDNLDIDIKSKSQKELKIITNYIYVSIYSDKSITIGDNNKIKNSKISS